MHAVVMVYPANLLNGSYIGQRAYMNMQTHNSRGTITLQLIFLLSRSLLYINTRVFYDWKTKLHIEMCCNRVSKRVFGRIEVEKGVKIEEMRDALERERKRKRGLERESERKNHIFLQSI